MRISDWSSDVCSSDLQGRNAGQGAGRSGCQAAPGRTARGDPRAVAPEPQRRPAAARLDVRNGRTQGEAARSARWPRLRSEEHTSELQSLMRISYAVLCLTQHNNKNLTRPATHTQPANIGIIR